MSVHIVRLGSERLPGEGLRIGAVRYPPRGVPKERHAADDWYDVWYPELAPSREAIRQAKAAEDDAGWAKFVKRYRKEMAETAPRHTLELLAALSHGADFSLGCYCQEEAHCHRSVLRALLEEHGADLAAG